MAPGLAARVATVPAPTASDDDTERFLVFAAAADLLRRLAGWRPLVVVLDDLQHAEPAAFLLLRHLLDALADAPVLFVLSSRDPADPETGASREELAALARVSPRRIELTGLDARRSRGDGVRHDHRYRGRAPAHADGGTSSLRDPTRPLLGRGRRPGSACRPTSRDVVWRRVRALGEPAPAILTAAAVLGTEFSEDTLTAMVDEPPGVVTEVLDATRPGRAPRRHLESGPLVALRALTRGAGPLRRPRTGRTRRAPRGGGPSAGVRHRPGAGDRRRAGPPPRTGRPARRRPCTGPSGPETTRSPSSRPPRPRSTIGARVDLAGRARPARCDAAPTSVCGSATRSTAPARPRRSRRSPTAPNSWRSGTALATRWSGPCSPPTAASYGSITAHRSSST